MVGLCLCWRHCSTSNIRNKRTVSCAFSFVCLCVFLYGPLDRSIAVKNGQQYCSSKVVQWLYGLYAFGGISPQKKSCHVGIPPKTGHKQLSSNFQMLWWRSFSEVSSPNVLPVNVSESHQIFHGSRVILETGAGEVQLMFPWNQHQCLERIPGGMQQTMSGTVGPCLGTSPPSFEGVVLRVTFSWG